MPAHTLQFSQNVRAERHLLQLRRWTPVLSLASGRVQGRLLRHGDHHLRIGRPVRLPDRDKGLRTGLLRSGPRLLQRHVLPEGGGLHGRRVLQAGRHHLQGHLLRQGTGLPRRLLLQHQQYLRPDLLRRALQLPESEDRRLLRVRSADVWQYLLPHRISVRQRQVLQPQQRVRRGLLPFGTDLRQSRHAQMHALPVQDGSLPVHQRRRHLLPADRGMLRRDLLQPGRAVLRVREDLRLRTG